MKVKLTQKFVDRDLLSPAGKKQVEFCDTELPGLYALVSSVSPGIGTYYLRYKTDAGKTAHKKIGRTNVISLKDARDSAKHLKLEISQGVDPQAETKQKRNEMTYSEFMEEHYFPYVTPRLRNAGGYRQQYDKYLKDAFGELKISQISKQMLVRFHDDLHSSKGLAKATANRYLQLIKASLNHGINMEILDLKRNPAVGIELFKEEGKERYLSKAEIERLMTVLSTNKSVVSRLIMYILSTGLRLGEAKNAEWQDIDMVNRVMRIPRKNAKSGKLGSVPLNDIALQVLSECDRSYPFVFANPSTAIPYVNITKSFQKIMKQAGINGASAHLLRHTHASILINNGRSLYDVQKILRHSSPIVTQKYAHISQSTILEASGTVAQDLSRAAAAGNQ